MREIMEIWDARDAMRERLTGFAILDVKGHPSQDFLIGTDLGKLNELAGRGDLRIEKVESRGQLLMVGFTVGAMLFHFGRSGCLAWWRQQEEHPLMKIGFWTVGDALVFVDPCKRKGGNIHWYDSWERMVLEGPQRKFGVEMDSTLFTPEWLGKVLQTSASTVGAVLLEDKFLAGSTNRFRCGVLNLAAVSPWRRCKTLTYDEVKRIWGAVKRITSRKHDGLCGEDVWGVTRQQSCRCGAPMERGLLDGWSISWCRNCQI